MGRLGVFGFFFLLLPLERMGADLLNLVTDVKLNPSQGGQSLRGFALGLKRPRVGFMIRTLVRTPTPLLSTTRNQHVGNHDHAFLIVARSSKQTPSPPWTVNTLLGRVDT